MINSMNMRIQIPSVLRKMLVLLFSLSIVGALTSRWTLPVVGASFQSLMSLSSWGMSHYMLWQFVTHLFVQPIGQAVSFSFFISLFFNAYLLYIVGKSLIELKGNKHFLWLFFGGGILSSLSTALLLYSLHMPFYLAGCSSAIYTLLAAWIFFYPEREVLFFLFFPIKIKWLLVIISGTTLFLDLCNGNLLNFIGMFTSIAFGYLYSLLAFEMKGPFVSMHNFESSVIQKKRKLFGMNKEPVEIYANPNKTKVYDFKTGKVVIDDEMFLDICLNKISKKGKGSLSYYERFRMWRISKRMKKRNT